MRKSFFIVIIIILCGCTSDEKMPANIFPVNSMKTIIWDLSVADNMASEKYVMRKDSQRMMATGLYQKIFLMHKIDRASFYKSYGYYEAHPEAMKVLFDSVSAYGMRKKALSYESYK